MSESETETVPSEAVEIQEKKQKKKNFTPAQIEVIKANLVKAREASMRKRAEQKNITERKKALKVAKHQVEMKAVDVAEKTLLQRIKELEEMVSKTREPAKPVKERPTPKPKPCPVVDDGSSCEDSEDDFNAKLKEIQKLRLEKKARQSADKIKTESASELLRRQVESLRDNYLKSWLLS